jgi:hypothetical protein
VAFSHGGGNDNNEDGEKTGQGHTRIGSGYAAQEEIAAVTVPRTHLEREVYAPPTIYFSDVQFKG